MQRCGKTGMCPYTFDFSDAFSDESSTTATPLRVGQHEPTPRGQAGAALAPRSLSESANLALGKYARVGSGRGHDARACASDDVAECFIAGRGEVLFVGLLVVVPGLRIPDLEVIDGSDHHTVLGQVGVTTVVGRQR